MLKAVDPHKEDYRKRKTANQTATSDHNATGLKEKGSTPGEGSEKPATMHLSNTTRQNSNAEGGGPKRKS